MSRYVRVPLRIDDLAGVELGLRQLGIEFERSQNRVMLRGSLERAGDPVDVRVEAGIGGSVEDFGFCRGEPGSQSGVELVCGEVDREQLERTVLGPLMAALASHAVHQAASRAGLQVEATVDSHGQRRIMLRRR